MLPPHPRRPSQIIGELLTGHPEAAGLAEAIHYQELSRSSSANVGQKFAAAETARLQYEELRHKLDPRRRRTIHFGAGLMPVVVLGACLTMLNGIEFSWLLGGRVVLGALAATAVWLTGGWLAALGSRKRRWPLILATINTAIFLALLLTTLHSLEPRPDWAAAGTIFAGSRFSAFSPVSSSWYSWSAPARSSPTWSRPPCALPGGVGTEAVPPMRRRSRPKEKLPRPHR